MHVNRAAWCIHVKSKVKNNKEKYKENLAHPCSWGLDVSWIRNSKERVNHKLSLTRDFVLT
jgi:hypothetical protein